MSDESSVLRQLAKCVLEERYAGAPGFSATSRAIDTEVGILRRAFVRLAGRGRVSIAHLTQAPIDEPSPGSVVVDRADRIWTYNRTRSMWSTLGPGPEAGSASWSDLVTEYGPLHVLVQVARARKV